MTAFSLTQTAEDELREILKFVTENDGLQRALSLYEEFVKAFERSPHFPRPDIGGRG